MKRQPWGLYFVALAILVVGLVAVGVPAQTLVFAALVLACPLRHHWQTVEAAGTE